ncbi:MAG: hypothetical protein ACPIOQ_73985, partial [Promethearchaeia archaeon]
MGEALVAGRAPCQNSHSRYPLLIALLWGIDESKHVLNLSGNVLRWRPLFPRMPPIPTAVIADIMTVPVTLALEGIRTDKQNQIHFV